MDEALNSGKIAWPGVMFSLETAFEFADQFLTKTKQEFHLLVGMSLPHDLVGPLLESEQNDNWYGPYVAARQGKAPAPGGQVLGYEILGYCLGCFHSWLCNNLVPELCMKFETRLNTMGFIDDAGTARRVAEYCDIVQSEPAKWLPWLLQVYSARNV